MQNHKQKGTEKP